MKSDSSFDVHCKTATKILVQSADRWYTSTELLDVEIDFAFLLATQNHIIYTRGIVRMDIFFDQSFTNNNFLSSVSCLTNMHYYVIFV